MVVYADRYTLVSSGTSLFPRCVPLPTRTGIRIPSRDVFLLRPNLTNAIDSEQDRRPVT